MTNRDDVEGLTRDLGILTLDPGANSEGDVSPISDCGGSEKRVKINKDLFSRYRSTTGTILDPLLFLRVNQSHDTVSESTGALLSEPPSLDEIFSEQRSVCETGHKPRAGKHGRAARQTSNPKQPMVPGVKLPVAVFRFCQENEVQFVGMPISRTYRSIAFSRTSSTLDPWERFIELNLISHYRLCHAVYLGFKEKEKEGRVVVLVPHCSKKSGIVDLEKLSSALQVEVFKVSLTVMEKELGFPTFVCPPFGHEFAPKLHAVSKEEKPKFLTAIDSSLVLEAQTECLFQLGIVGMRIRPAELKRLASGLHWTVLEDLVRRL